MDVDALTSLAFGEHTLHERVANWLNTLNSQQDTLACCAITELGVVRILSLPMAANLSILDARTVLSRVKASSVIPFIFIPDAVGADHLPRWVTTSKQTTDGHLVALAKAHDATLATCDRKIPGAFVIPVS